MARSGARARLYQTLLPALGGALVGYAVGEAEGVRAVADIMLPLYALMGAIGGILVFRIAILVRELVRDFRSDD